MTIKRFYAPAAECCNYFYNYIKTRGLLVDTVEKADYLLLPFNYEVIYDYNDAELAKNNLSVGDLSRLRQMARELDELSVQYLKKLIVFFYRDAELPLQFKNALVFRTSGRKSRNEISVYGMPAFVDHRPANLDFQVRKKIDKPYVSFRGLAAPLQLPFSMKTKMAANSLLTGLGANRRFKIWYNEGYILRRAAIMSVLNKQKDFTYDFIVNANYGSNNPFYKNDYLASFLKNDYFICAAGHGNYSYRLYEVMREGRFPVFIDTDCLLPCNDKIDWKSLLLWIPRPDVNKTAEIILDFHSSIHPDDFAERQLKIKGFWSDYLSLEGFSKYIVEQFN